MPSHDITILIIFAVTAVIALLALAWAFVFGLALFRYLGGKQEGKATRLAIAAVVIGVAGAFTGPFALLLVPLSMVLAAADKGRSRRDPPNPRSGLLSAHTLVAGALLILAYVVVIVFALPVFMAM